MIATILEIVRDTLFEAIQLDPIERDGIGADVETEFLVEFTDDEIRAWTGVGDVLRAVRERKEVA